MPFDVAYSTGAVPGGATPAPAADGARMFGDDGLTFGDVLDVINPLQHIPVVSAIYRDLTGDTISPAARIAGGGLFGGIFGLFVAVANVAVEQQTGQDVGGHMVAMFDGDGLADGATRLSDATPGESGAASGSTNPGEAIAAYTRTAELRQPEFGRQGGP